MAKLIKHLTLDVSEMDLDTPYQDGDFDAVKVKKFVEVTAGEDSVWRHGLERVPNHIEIVYSDLGLSYPQVVSLDREIAVLRFDPSQPFNIVLRFA